MGIGEDEPILKVYNIFWVWPLPSDHQDYSIFSRESHFDLYFSTWLKPPTRYIIDSNSSLGLIFLSMVIYFKGVSLNGGTPKTPQKDHF